LESAAPAISAADDRLDRWAKKVALHLLWVVPTMGLLGIYAVRVFQGLYLSEAMDLAQIARHVSRGEGFATSFLRPVAMLRGAGLQPDVANPPLFPLVLAVVFGVFPAADSTVAAVSSAFHVLTLLAVFALGKRLFDWRVGALAAVLYGVTSQALTSATAGIETSMALFLAVLAFYVLLGEPAGVKKSAGAGVLAALSCLASYAGAFLLPVLAGLAYHRGRGKAAASLTAAFALVCAPWMIRNYLVTRDPFFTLQLYLPQMFMGSYPGHTLLRSADTSQLSLMRFLADHPTEIVKKLALGAQGLWQSGPALLGLGVAGLVVVGLFLPFKSIVTEPYRKATYWLLGLLAVWAAVSTMTPEALALAAPLAAVLAAGLLFTLTARQSASSRAVVVLALVGIQAFPALVGAAWPPSTRNPSREGLEYLRRATPEQALIVTDVPWAVSWYADRAAVWLPATENDFAAVDKRRRVDAVFLSWLVQTYTQTEQALWWKEMYVAANPPAGFEVGSVFAPGDVLFTRSENAQERNEPTNRTS
jgi:hypothetical protein